MLISLIAALSLLLTDVVAISRSNDSACSGTVTLTGTSAPFSAPAVSSCSTWFGDITIIDVPLASATASGLPAEGNYESAEVNLDFSLQEVQGNIFIGNFTASGAPTAANGTLPGAVTISFGYLNLINGTLWIENIPAKVSIELNYQNSTTIAFLYLNNLSLYEVLQGDDSEDYESYYLPQGANPSALFLGNTNLQAIELGYANKVYAWDNPLLNNITVTASSVIDLRVKGNGNDLHIGIGAAQNASLRLDGVDSLDAPSLSLLLAWEDLEGYPPFGNNETAGGYDYFPATPLDYTSYLGVTTAIFTNNTFTTLSLPALSILYYLDLGLNPYLSSIDIPNVNEIGAINITNNTRLEVLDFPKLNYVDFYLNFSGPFTSISLPAFTNTPGDVLITSDGSFNCTPINNAVAASDIVKGKYNCQDVAPATSSAHSGGLSTGAQAGIGVGVAIVGCLIIAGGVLLFLRAKRKQKKERTESAQTNEAEKSGISQPGGPMVHEADNQARGQELPTQEEKPELPASHGVSEVPQAQTFELEGQQK